VAAELKAKFLVKLAQTCLNRRLALITAPARQRPLTAMGPQVGRTHGQQQCRPGRGSISLDERDHDRGPLQRRRRFGRRQARKCRAALRDVPAGGIVKWPGHPA
jgi:hypothetical protein